MTTSIQAKDHQQANADSIKTRVDTLLSRMTLAEKIGQMTQVEVNSISPQEVADYFIGSMLSGGGGNPTPNNPQSWADMVHKFAVAAQKSRLAIPLIYGSDAVHGHNNVIGAVIFPHNIGLGAANDETLVEDIARVTARELLATGVHWNFAPTVAVPQDIRWGRTYEGYGENTALVSRLGAAYVRGLQNADGQTDLAHPETVLASVKHFVGDGGTTWGTTERYEWMIRQWIGADRHWHIDQGVTEVDEATLRAVHLPPYQAAIQAGARNIMVSYSSWNETKMHAHRYLLTDVLKGELGFSGFLVTDWMAIDQIEADFDSCVVRSINAGIDMVMVPFNFKRFIDSLTRAVESGDVSQERIDDAVGRILRVKFELGLFERPFGDEALRAEMGSPAHRAVARRGVRQSLVLLKNESGTLPLAKNTPHILVAGQAADDIGLQCGGWTIEWMGRPGPITPGTTLLEAIQATVNDDCQVDFEAQGQFEVGQEPADIGLVVLSEMPYAEGTGDKADLNLPAEDIALLKRMRPLCRRLVVILYSGRPLIIGDQINDWDAFVAAWLPGSEGQGVTDVLFGDSPFRGRLPYSWPQDMDQVPLQALRDSSTPPLFEFGAGL